MAYVNLKHMPSPRQEYTVNFVGLNGGLNLSELEYQLKNTESPAMKNLIWRDGVLCSRSGQEWVLPSDSTNRGYGRTLYERLFHNNIFAHIGNKIYRLPVSASSPAWVDLGVSLGSDSVRGTFFQYDGELYYKTVGKYIQITYNASNGSFSCAAVEGYIPTTHMNADPTTGAGDLYQPVNRIQSKRRVLYNGNGSATTYNLPEKGIAATGVADVTVKVGGETVTPSAVNATSGTVTFSTAPAAGQNNVEIVYSKTDSSAYDSVMSCKYAATYGGTGELCVVMGGCSIQPNAIFWNGNNIVMDPTYFPVNQYQFCGDASNPITGFGKQQSYLVIFQERSVGRVKQDVQTIDGRVTIDLPYVAINDKIGCDLPWTIQLIDNNLVWCNTEQGVHILKDSSYAYENNIENVSRKVNGNVLHPGVLQAVREAEEDVVSLDDSKRYWLCVDGKVYLWDYENSGYKDPSWYFYTDINAVAFASELDDIWHLNKAGKLTHLVRSYSDYDQPIVKSYRFATQVFGGYDRLKNVNSVIIVLRPDTSSETELRYLTDYEQRRDRTDLSHLAWSLAPRNLAFRYLGGTGFGAAFRRRPMCRRVRHFTMQLDNNKIGQDLSVVSAQIFYNYQGRMR